VRKAQRFLRDLDFYRDSLDGRPGPQLEEALLSYQKFIRLPLTGRLDLETLSAMRLLPGRGGAPVRPVTVPGPEAIAGRLD
jgi:peptidoglycan hydrolase-like protein with peptidoglycan-binding domain